jgi:hypothetical protein
MDHSVSHPESEPFEPSTYFGIWSLAKYSVVADMLRQRRVRFWHQSDNYSEDILREWCAWDPQAEDPYVGIDLWIHSDDLELVGYSVVERFPERRFE